LTLQWIVIVVAACQAIYWSIGAWLTRRHFTSSEEPPGEIRSRISVLKPLRDAERDSFECFATYCRQDYADYSILFGVADAEDPAVPVVRRVQREFPSRDVQLRIGQAGGLNPKVRILRRLVDESDGEILATSDADVKVNPDHLRRLAAPLADTEVGLVMCAYTLRGGRSVTDRLEALRLAVEFIPSAIFARKLGVAVGFGAAMAIRRSDLDQIGGFAAFSDQLLEDQKLASRITGMGKRIVLLPSAVELCAPGNSFSQSWRREVRWGRGIRATGPWRYLGVGVTFTTPLLVLAAIAHSRLAWIAVGMLALIRLAAAICSARAQRASVKWTDLWLLPVRDAMSFLIWCASLYGRRVEWRGRQYYVGRDGRISATAPPSRLADALQRSIRRFDAYLRRRQNIFEFCQSADCMLRLRTTSTSRDVLLADGTHVRPGDSVGELHLWNERLATMGELNSSFRWSVEAWRATQSSFRHLAEAVQNDPRLRGVDAFVATALFGQRGGDKSWRKMCDRLGIEIHQPPGQSLARRIHDFFENFLTWGLNWTFSRSSLRGKPFLRVRRELWISRRTLLAKHLPDSSATMIAAGAQ